MPARLIVEAGTASPPVCELNPEKVVSLGRNKLSHVILRDHHASRLHAQIFHKDRCWYLRDCGATNRTELNGKVITKKDTVALDNGARIVIGKIHLRFLTSLTDVTPPSGNPLAGNPEADASADQDSTALHVDELSALVTFLNDSLLETTPYGLLKLAMDVVQHQTGATLCGFLSLDPDDPLPRVVVPAEGAVDAALSKQLTRLAMGANQAIWLARTKAADADSESLAAFSDAICIPLGARSPGNGSSEAAPGAPLGALHVYKTNHPFTEHQFRFCEALAGSLASTLQVLRARRALEADNSRLSRRAPNQGDELVGGSPAMQRLRYEISKLAERPRVVLIEGETGVGKELVALGLHRNSSRRDGPLVPVNCSAIVATMAEAELFGHEKGAFTNATHARPGHFRLADEGTLFLDEIGELSLECQAKLLRVLETNSFRPVGAAADVTVDVRVVAATNRDLKKEVREGRFRGDLYYRLGTSIRLPPLRDHSEDIPALVEHFLKKLNTIHHRKVGVSEAALRQLMTEPWPGNVRQLGSVLETAVAMAENDLIQPNDLRLVREPVARDGPPSLNLEELQTWAIREALRQTGGNKSQAARLLGIHRDTLTTRARELEE